MTRSPKIYLSASNSDLFSLRKSVATLLKKEGCEVVNSPDRHVESLMDECDAVVHFAGLAFGPPGYLRSHAIESETRESGPIHRSFIENEFNLAEKLGKPIFPVLCGENFPFDEHPLESEDLREAQLRHRNRIRHGKRKFWQIDSPDACRGMIEEILSLLRPGDASSGISSSEPPKDDLLKWLTSDGLTVRDLFARSDLSERMSKSDREAFRMGAILAQWFEEELTSMGLLLGYLLTAPLTENRSDATLVKAVWRQYVMQDTDKEIFDQIRMEQVYSRGEMNAYAEKTFENQSAGLDGKVSCDLGALLGWSLQNVKMSGHALRFSRRHLLACLISPNAAAYDPNGFEQIHGVQGLRVDLTEVRRMYRDWLSRNRPQDQPKGQRVLDEVLGVDADQASGAWNPQWDHWQPIRLKIFVPRHQVMPDPSDEPKPPAEDFVEGPPGYNSEFCGVGGDRPVVDHLGVEELADRFSALIALRETKLPLAIGVFGDWGSGKSHFMNLIDRRLKKLVQGGGVENGSPWCREIVPIYFNAWHYYDASLMASLVTEIFDALALRLAPKPDELALMNEELRKAGGATARAEREAIAAHEAVCDAKDALDEANENSRSAQATIGRLMSSLDFRLGELLPMWRSESGREQIAGLLGVEAEVATLSELAEKNKELAALPGLLKATKARLLSREGCMAWLVGFVAMALGILAPKVWPSLGSWLDNLGHWVKPVLAVAGAAAAPVLVALQQVRKGLQQMKDWQAKAEKARENLPRVVEAKREKEEAEKAAESAQNAVTKAKLLEQKIKGSIDDLHPGRRLGRFIEARSQSGDYRGQLGLVSLARRDFQELSGIFADAGALQEKAAALAPEEAARLKKLGSSVDRIVLFVDDLDRCQPEKVVEVLQAIHLLLAFPLFAVVVGVDQRCLKHSLENQFHGLLSSADKVDAGTRRVTPLDYLEKIFHIPFHLPPMDQGGFATLIRNLTRTSTSPHKSESMGEVAPALPRESGASPSIGNSGPLTVSQPLPATQNAAPALPSESKKAIGRSVLEEEEFAFRDESVPLHAWETDALENYHSLLCTPRGATRLLNTYRLVRAGIPAREWENFRGNGRDGEFRVVMFLLAATAGHPADARRWFEGLRLSKAASPFDEPPHSTAEWKPFEDAYAAVFTAVSPPPGRKLFVKWLPAVERFAF